MTSLTLLLCRHLPFYYDVTILSIMTSLSLLLLFTYSHITGGDLGSNLLVLNTILAPLCLEPSVPHPMEPSTGISLHRRRLPLFEGNDMDTIRAIAGLFIEGQQLAARFNKVRYTYSLICLMPSPPLLSSPLLRKKYAWYR